MAGRGRGRGKNVSFNVEALGFGRGEALPGPISQPPPLFPVLKIFFLSTFTLVISSKYWQHMYHSMVVLLNNSFFFFCYIRQPISSQCPFSRVRSMTICWLWNKNFSEICVNRHFSSKHHTRERTLKDTQTNTRQPQKSMGNGSQVPKRQENFSDSPEI